MGTTPAERGYEEGYYQRPYFADHSGKRGSTAAIVEQLRSGGLANGHVLDVGAGAGFLLRALAEVGYAVSGMDLTQEALTRARKNTDAELRLGDVCKRIPFEAQTFQGVVMHDVIEHLPEPRPAMDEVRRVLVPGGILLVSTLNEQSILHTLLGKRWSYYSDPTHVCMYGIASLTRLLEDSGLQVVRHWTYFDLNKAGETTAWMRPLRALGRVVHVPKRGESITVIARKPDAELPAR